MALPPEIAPAKPSIPPADQAETRIGGATSSIYAAISKLHKSGVIRHLTDRTRSQIWVAASHADELGVRIAARARDASL